MAAKGKGWKSIPALKFNILWDMVGSILYMVPIQFQESVLPHIIRLKILFRLHSPHPRNNTP
jgi:hypothetical protein